MGTGLLIALLLQSPPPASHDEWHARLSAGAFGGYLVAAFGDDSAYGFAAGAEVSVPIWKRTNIDARALRWFPSAGYGFYDLRLRQMVGRTGASRFYAAAGLAGTFDDEGGGRSPELLSVALGAELTTGPHVVIPLEVSAMTSFRNAVAVVVTAGVKWVR